MAGVIDSNGQQWEHCNACGEFIEIEKLLYEEKSEEFKYGRDLCPDCAKLSTGKIRGATLVKVSLATLSVIQLSQND